MKKQNLLQTIWKNQLLSENCQEILLFFNGAGNIIDCNATAKEELGYGDNIYQVSITDIFTRVIKKENNNLFIYPKYLKGTAAAVAYRNNQTCFDVSLRVAVKSKKKAFIGLCTAVNRSEEKEIFHQLIDAKNELKSFDQLKNEFVANITHELRTPVNGIMGLTENLLETEMIPRQVETVNIIHRCCATMNTIINDLLDYTKIANHKLVLEQREFNFCEFFDHIVTFNFSKINEKGLKLLINVADDIPDIVIGDEFRLAQILNNLISNAVKFTSIGQIALEVVKTAQTDHEIELFFLVLDTGIGINNEDRDKLFKSFSQVDGSITRRYGGTGLGLSISKMLVEAMNGTIAVESEKNKGSTFSFSVRLRTTNTQENINSMDNTNAVRNDSEHTEIKEEILLLKEEIFSNSPENENSKRSWDEANISSQWIQDTFSNIDINEKSFDRKEILKDILEAIEKLSICIEMESWEKAEFLADTIKKLIPKDHKLVTEKAFHLLLSVRRENHDTSIAIINELKAKVEEVLGWKM